MVVPAPAGEQTDSRCIDSIPDKIMLATCDGESAEALPTEDKAELASARAFVMAAGKCMLEVCSFGICVAR